MSLPAVRTALRRAGPSSQPARAFGTSAAVRAQPQRKTKAKPKTNTNPDALPLNEAVRVLRALEIANPSSAFTIELTTKFTKGGLPLRGRIAMPTDPRKVSDTIVVFAKPDSPSGVAARDAGAHYVGTDDLFPKILSGEIVPTKCLATPSALPMVAKSLARFLGPKGLMPVAKRGTVGEGEELGRLIKAAGGTLEWKADKLGVVRAPVARMTFGAPAVEQNIRAFINAVREGSANQAASDTPLARVKQSSHILKARLETTNGPSVELSDVL